MCDQRALATRGPVLEDPPLDLAPLPRARRQLVVFDFDWSLADQDTDRWVHEVLSPRLRLEFVRLLPHMQFTDMCAHLLVELHREGHTRAELEDALRRMPVHPAMVRAVRALHAGHPDTDFFLLSNSNTAYIGTILPAAGLDGVFAEVVTNPAHWDGELLRLTRRIPADAPPHGCTVGCSANMCKGAELDAFLARHAPYDRIVYVGDGGNDYCPVARLGPHDAAFVRRHRGLAQRVAAEGVQCAVRYWTGAWEAEQLLRLLLLHE